MIQIANPYEQISHQLEELKEQNHKLYQVVSCLEAKIVSAQDKENDIITMNEACKLLGRSKPTVYGLRSRREIPCLENGRFSRTDLIKWLETKKRKTNAEIAAGVASSFTRKKKERDK